MSTVCVPPCQRAPECGDGYRCEAGACIASHLTTGDTCGSEVDCEAGLSCQLSGKIVDKTGRLVATCTAQNPGSPVGSSCAGDSDCRNGTCEFGHCVDLCRADIDCPASMSCQTMPRIFEADGALYSGCLPAQGPLSFPIPITSASDKILLPVSSMTTSAELVMSVDDPAQQVGVSSVLDPCGCTRYTVPCPFAQPGDSAEVCTDIMAADQFYSQLPTDGAVGLATTNMPPSACGGRCSDDSSGGPINHIRHLPAFGQSVMLLPSIQSSDEIKYGAYRVVVSSFAADNSPGTAIPHVTAVVRIGFGSQLAVHFFFLDLSDHACAGATGGTTLDAAQAATAAFFQRDYLGRLNTVLGNGAHLTIIPTYDDIADRHDLDGLDVADVGSLLQLGRYPNGINVFFVRSLSPAGTQAFSPNPGPSGVASTRGSGIVISLDTLCYRDWQAIARLTAHEIARYMGLYHNVEPKDPEQAPSDPPWQDLIDDSDMSSDNLMYFSDQGGTDHGGTKLSPGQAQALTRSAALQ